MPPLNNFDMVVNSSIRRCTPNNVLKEKNNFDHQHDDVLGKRRVSFYTLVIVQEVLHLNDYSQQEKKASWYSRREVEDIKAEAREIIAQSATKNLHLRDDDWCSRGLEARTKSEDRMNITRAVLLEQRHQVNNMIHDPEAIAQIYTGLTDHPRARAGMMGKRDEFEAKHAYQ